MKIIPFSKIFADMHYKKILINADAPGLKLLGYGIAKKNKKNINIVHNAK